MYLFPSDNQVLLNKHIPHFCTVRTNVYTSALQTIVITIRIYLLTESSYINTHTHINASSAYYFSSNSQSQSSTGGANNNLAFIYDCTNNPCISHDIRCINKSIEVSLYRYSTEFYCHHDPVFRK